MNKSTKNLQTTSLNLSRLMEPPLLKVDSFEY